MKRIIDRYLATWKNSITRKPILLRGARQVGKTYTIRALGATFDNIVEVNFERVTQALDLFALDLDPHRIVRDLSVLLDVTITPGKTLLFFDEVQEVPRAIMALRYFYESMPELHVIAAGSLIDFALHQVGIPVGRVVSLHMYPMSFVEFLWALGHERLVNAIMEHEPDKPLSQVLHTKALNLVGQYCAVGGMPEVVACWQQDTHNPLACFERHKVLINAYRQDFNKYAKKHQVKYVRTVFRSVPLQLGRTFKYAAVEGEFRRRELEPAFELLCMAGVIHKVVRSAGQGIPIGAFADLNAYKALFLDVALAQTVLGLDVGPWIVDPLAQFVNKGELIEAMVGQELLAYADPLSLDELFYWARQERSSQAEIDYLVQLGEHVIPIEVKSGVGTTLKSMHLFLDSHPKSPYGIRFSAQNYSQHEKIHSYPFYAVAQAIGKSF